MTTMEQRAGKVELVIGGMTCAACANRVERKLNKVPGVAASVNYATERAVVTRPGDVTVEQLVATVEAAGYQAALPSREPVAEPGADRALYRRLLVSAALAVPVILLSMVPAFQFSGWEWVALALTTPVAVWGAAGFHRTALLNLRHLTFTMDTLVSLGVTVAYLWSVYALVNGLSDEHAGMAGMDSTVPAPYLEVAAGVTTFLLLGRWLEARAKRRAGAAVRALLELGAKDVAVLRDGVEHRIPAELLRAGDHFVVRPGEKIAADGSVTEGVSAVDQSLVTGESVPAEVGIGSEVIGGTVNIGGRLIVRAARVGADTQLAQMARLVAQAQAGKAAVQRLADRVSGIFVPAVLTLSLLTLLTWLVIGQSLTFAVTAAVAVLVIACPCALGLATPTALLVGTGRGAQLGILIKGPEVLESTRRVDTIVLDKTGTVTTGRMSLVDVMPANGTPRAEILRLAAAVESASEHPVAAAVVAAAQAPLPLVTGFRNIEGLGVTGTVEGRTILVGRPRLLEEHGITVPPDLIAHDGATVIAAAADGILLGALAIADTLKPTSKEAVRRFRALGLHPILLTGDNAAVAANVATQLGITDVISDVLPAEKVAAVRRLQSEGRVVAMVGDGVNDAPALATADLGLSIGTGSDIAIEAGDLTLVHGDLRTAADAIRLSRRTLRIIKGNLAWAFGYNVAALPVAALGLLNPMFAGAAMAFSSVFVVGNSLRLRHFRPERQSPANPS